MKCYYILSLAILLSVTSYGQQSLLNKPIVGAGMDVDPYSAAITKSGHFKLYGVASAHRLASAVGASIMKRGGNAFDAAVAVQLALAVVYPGAGNIGGGGFMTAHRSNGDILTLDFREKAPLQATKDMYLDAAGNANSELSQNGVLSVGTPGSVAGIFQIMPFAKLPFADLITPAIELAEHGFRLTQHEADDLNSQKADFLKYNNYPVAFVKDTGEWHMGDIFIQKDLAKTLRLIRDKGMAGFYSGKTAKLIISTIKKNNGILSANDLLSYNAVYRTPLIFNYRGYHIASFPPPSSGGIILGQILKMIEPFPVNALGVLTPQSTHLTIEAERRAYADRAKYLGDPDFVHVPDSVLLSSAYLQQRMSNYQDEAATPSDSISAGWIPGSEETTHISIADNQGNAVSITTTLNNHFGSKIVVKDAGFVLNDEMDDFSAKPGSPNLYGAVGGAANAIAPSKRMLSSMAPTLILNGNQVRYVLGSPGGTTIPTSVAQCIIDLIDYHMPIDSANALPRYHHQWLPDNVFVEQNLPKATSDILKTYGHKIIERPSIGRVELIELKNGLINTSADIRGDDSVAGE